ncbi:exosome complex RNA-binding protein Rrp4 [Staphylothermus hellenicus]|uniref:Exosome complex component Rrp4 n=1 Tax=Staphylothermus hellenicus (strain DSM 12710 / JCM 10830 / BK20S6-10-b1 / P8) TaxID=591019 RepID=D7DAA2_STAHD|nr:exosome complex RNA-binding protein Rrp4 [Staphylothermus hellenicus]ADI32698.1 K-like, type 1, subgroup [Staphylothermus hellenicus DSM 12710]
MDLKILVADRQIVRPGDILAIIENSGEATPKYLPEKHVYIAENRIYSDVLGIVSITDKTVSVIPLEGVYFPKKDDLVIGLVTGVGITNWIIDIRAPYKAILNGSEVIEGFNPIIHNLRDYLDIGEYILAKISVFDRTRDPILTIKGKGLGKITEGTVIEVKPSRVPRIIGKKGSMLNLLTSKTGCNIVVAQNGMIWARCPDNHRLNILIQALKIIEDKVHMRGLTEEIRLFLDKSLGEEG